MRDYIYIFSNGLLFPQNSRRYWNGFFLYMWRFKTNNKITTLINYTYRNNSRIISAIFLPSNVLEFAGLYIYILKWSTFSPKFPTIMKWIFLYMWRFKTPLVMSHKDYASLRHVNYALKPNCKYVMTICFFIFIVIPCNRTRYRGY